MIIGNLGIRAKLRRNVLLPIYWKYVKKWRTLEYYKKLKDWQWKTIEENREIQRKNLYMLIKYVSQNIPYYKQIIQEYNIQFSEDNIFEDIKKFPILTKDIIRNNFDKLFKFRDNTYYRNSSSGSTGEPLIFYQDRNYLEWQIAIKILFDEWSGRKLGEPMVKLWGLLRDILKGGEGFKGYLKQQLYGVIILPSYKMTEKDMYKYVHRINKIKPRLILAYISSIDELARFIKENCLSIYSPYAIMTSAGVLYPEARVRIEKIFQAPVFNRYGSTEMGDIACNCEKNHGLHLIPSVHYLEIMEDDDGKEVSQEELGEIIITLLTNYTMPLIRYKIGDRGIFSSEKECSCGRGLPLLKKVEGYIGSVLRNKKGDLIDSGFFFHIFFFRDYIKQFQVIQESMENITINFILKDTEYIKIAEKDFIQISQAIKKVMGSDTIIKYKLVDVIEPSPSGKYLAVLSKVED